MKTGTYLDRTDWPAGPWDQEPVDRVEWRDSTTGLPCIARRAALTGAWCGYVAVPPGHPWHGLGCDDADAAVHGGLTYAASADEADGLCHVPEVGEAADVHWLGFDCAHAGDRSPGMEKLSRWIGSEPRPWVYRDLTYVQDECAGLARQAQAVGNLVVNRKPEWCDVCHATVACGHVQLA